LFLRTCTRRELVCLILQSRPAILRSAAAHGKASREGNRPLSGIPVLDLTRVVAGPTALWPEKGVARLCAQLADAGRAALHADKLLDGIADLACLGAVLRGAPDGWDEDCRHKLDETLAQPELLDRFVWYCFGETEADVALIHAPALVADRAALRERVVARLREAAELPEQIRRAHQIAESKL
jgi:hypothetical protein